MKYLLLIIILLTSCRQANVDKTPTKFVLKENASPLEIVEIDRCQYLYGDWGGAIVFTHKGNCTNPIHPEHLRHSYK
jgi:hypothetical protein